MTWINPVTDRTDTYSKTHEKIASPDGKLICTSDGEKIVVWTTTDRPYLNDVDLIRIELDCQYLSDLLNIYGYNQDLTHKTDWDMADFPYASQMERIRTNVLELIEVYHEQDVPLPDTLERPNYQTVNDLENNLKLMKEMIHRMEQSFRYSGTFYSGQEVAF